MEYKNFEKLPIKVIGMMSGTSLDGVDLAFCEFWKEYSKNNID
jgi:1,6-anhydro-N-acetylmuramate kinase